MIKSSIAVCLSLIVILVLLFRPTAPMEKRAEPIFYLIHTEAYKAMDGDIRIIMDYSVNGEAQTQAIFYSEKEREAFIKHLDFLGVVYGY